MTPVEDQQQIAHVPVTRHERMYRLRRLEVSDAPAPERREVQVKLMLTATEADELRTAARAEGTGLSQYVVDRHKARPVASFDLGAANELAQLRVAMTQVPQSVRDLKAELGRLSGRLASFFVRDNPGLALANQEPDRRVRAVPWFRWDLDPDAQLGRRHLLIIDELSTLGAKQGAALLEGARRAGAIVLGFGDHKQFGSVSHGNLITEWMRLDPGVDLERTRRQNLDVSDADPEWMRRATEAVARWPRA